MKKEKKHGSSVENKKQENNDSLSENEKFPGYPLYPESEDIMNPYNNLDKIPLDDIEDSDTSTVKIEEPKTSINPPQKVDMQKSTFSETDITKEDLAILNSDELNSDGGDDDDLKKRTHPVDMSANDLDIPGTELDDEDENIGEEDEENNSYSIGGDRHEDLEDNTGKD